MNSEEKHTGKVAATVIPRTKEEKEFLVALRVDYEEEEWEFPGGKEEFNEDGNPEGLKATAEREIKEELDIEIEAEEVGKKILMENRKSRDSTRESDTQIRRRRRIP